MSDNNSTNGLLLNGRRVLRAKLKEGVFFSCSYFFFLHLYYLLGNPALLCRIFSLRFMYQCLGVCACARARIYEAR
jgi:hypothetical protein